MTPSLAWRGRSWKGPVRNGSGRSLGTAKGRGRGEGARSTCTAEAGSQKGRGKGKGKNAGEQGEWAVGTRGTPNRGQGEEEGR